MSKKLTSGGLTLLTLIALALPAVRPLLRGALACTDDAAFHLLRLTQLDALLRQGVWYSRWAPDMAGGYGFPLFNFYAPLSYYAAELVSLAAGNLNLGLRLTFALGLVLSGGAMYRLAREYMGRPAALTAAAAYIYAPYQGYDVYFRGNLAESFAWWLLPLALWCAVRLMRSNTWRRVALTGIAFAAVLLTHNIFALIFSPLLAVFGLWEIWEEQRADAARIWRPRLVRLALALLLGLALSAFFWLPALVERGLIHTERLLVPPVFVYWGNFVTLGELFSPPLTVHPDLINPSIPRSLGLVHLLLALPSLLWWWPGEKTGRLRFRIGFWWLVLAAALFMMLSPSRPVWEALPLIEFVQFPWRLLGIAALPSALLIGAGVEAVQSRWPASTLAVWGPPLLVTAVLILGTLYWFDPRFCPGLSNPTVADIGRFERATQTIGTTAKGEYLPLTVEALPAEPYSRPFSAPAGMEILEASRTPLALTGRVRAETAGLLTANIFVYPGLAGWVNGEKVDITPAKETGLAVLTLPAGENEVEIVFGETPLRRLTDWLSAAAAAAALLLLLISPASRSPLPASRSLLSVPLLLFFLALFAFTTWLLPRLSTPFYRPGLPELQQKGDAAVYEGGLVLLDYRLASRAMPADGSLPVTLWLTAARPLNAFFQSRVQLVDREGVVWSGQDTVWPRVYRPYYDSRDWPAGGYAQELLLAEGLAGTPPGAYTVELVVFDRETLRIAPLVDGRTALPLGTVQLSRPAEPFVDEGRFPVDPAAGEFGAVRLLSYSPDREDADAGDPFLLTAFWQAESDPAGDLAVRLELVDINTNGPVWESRFAPVSQEFPTSEWRAGDVWRGRYALRLPAALPTGRYHWQICLTPGGEASCLDRPVVLSEIAINAPERLYEAPAPEIALPAGQTLGALAELLGADLTPCPSTPALPCAVRLQWRAAVESEISYRVFLQLLGPDGRIAAQSDGEPAGWRRPTTGWLPGEIILDERRLAEDLADLPAGVYTLIAGLYDPADGVRLVTQDGRSDLVVTTVEIP